MPFIGKQPSVGAYSLMDSITTSATATYALTVNGSAYFPETARNLIVSLNGVTQAPEDAYTVSGSNIVFASALTSSDVIDYILALGDVLNIGQPSDGTVGTAQMSYPLGNFSSTGIDDNATSTAITIDASENVGINTTNPLVPLHVETSGTSTTIGDNAAVTLRSKAAGRATTLQFSDGTNANWISALSGNLGFATNNTERMRIDSSGNVGYSGKLFSSTDLTTLGGLQLYRDHATGSCYLFDSTTAPYSGPLIFGTSNAEGMRLDTSGNLIVTGNVTAYSDERLKSDVETLDGSKVYEMRGVSFTKDGEASSGVIAQELQKVAPELVNDSGEYLSVAYGNLVGYLIEAVKELKAEIEELKGVK